MTKHTDDEQAIPVTYEGGEHDGWVRRAPWPVDEDGRPIDTDTPADTTAAGDGGAQPPHYREPDATEQDDAPNRRRLLWVTLGVLAALVLGLVLWSVFDGTKSSTSKDAPSAATSSASGRAADPVAVKNAITYETAQFAGPREDGCKVAADAATCADVAKVSGTIPLAGLTKPITALKTAHIDGKAGNSDAALPDGGTPGTTVVLVEIHAKNQPATQYEAVAVRDSDRKVIGTKTVNDENRTQPLESIGQQIITEEGQ